MNFLKKASTAIRGTPEQRQEKQRQSQELSKAKADAYHQGKIEGVKAGAKRQGYSDGKRQGQVTPGFIGSLDSTVKGLNRVESAMGFDKMFNYQPVQPTTRKKKKQKEDSDPWGVGLPY